MGRPTTTAPVASLDPLFESLADAILRMDDPALGAKSVMAALRALPERRSDLLPGRVPMPDLDQLVDASVDVILGTKDPAQAALHVTLTLHAVLEYRFELLYGRFRLPDLDGLHNVVPTAEGPARPDTPVQHESTQKHA